MTREEAIELVKRIKGAIVYTEEEKKALEILIPELRESEDEKIRKWLYDYISNCPNNNFAFYGGVGKDAVLNYLEKQKENPEKEYVFRPLAGTDITIAAEQAIRRVNEGDRLVLAFNGAYIPVRRGCNANKIVDIYNAFIKNQKEQKESLRDFIDDFPYSVEQKEQELIESEFKTPDWVYGRWDSEYMINTVIGRYSLHAEVAEKRGDTHEYNLSKSMENWLRNVVKPLILEKQKEQTEELSIRLNGLMQEYVKAGEDEEEQEHRLKCYQLFWDALGDSEFFEQKEQKPAEYLPKRKVYDIMNKLTELSTSDLIPIESEEYVKIHEITSDVCSLLDYPIEQKSAKWNEDEKIRKAIIKSIEEDSSVYEQEVSKDAMIAWLEKQKDIDAIKKDWFERGKKEVMTVPELYGLQKKEQKPTEWSEEDEEIIYSLRSFLIQAEQSGKYGSIQIAQIEQCLNWLKSLRPQSKDEIYKAKDEAFKLGKHHLAIKFMNYLDENRPEGKMGLSNTECEDIDKAFKENDWAKIMIYVDKYLPHWKPSEEQMDVLKNSAYGIYQNGDGPALRELYEQLKKLM